MDSTPDTGGGATPPPVALTLRPPSACSGSDGWHDRRLDALDALTRSPILHTAAARARAAGQSVQVPTLAHVLTRLVLATKAPGAQSKYAASGQVSETRDHLAAQTLLSVDQLYRAIRALRVTGVVVEVAPALSPTPKHSTGRPPVYCLPWLFDHSWLAALTSGSEVEVEAIAWQATEAPEMIDEWGRASAPPPVDNSTGEREWGRACAPHPPAHARPSSESSDPLLKNEEGLARQFPQNAEKSSETRIEVDPEQIDTAWLTSVAETTSMTGEELRGIIIGIWETHRENLSTLDATDGHLRSWLVHPQRETRYAALLDLVGKARRHREANDETEVSR